MRHCNLPSTNGRHHILLHDIRMLFALCRHNEIWIRLNADKLADEVPLSS